MADAGVQTEQTKEEPLQKVEKQKRSGSERFVDTKRKVGEKVAGIKEQLRRTRKSAPDVDLKQEEEELNTLNDDQRSVNRETDQLLSHSETDDAGERKEELSMKSQEMAAYKFLQSTAFEEINQNRGWKNELSGQSYMDAIDVYDYINGAKVNGPLAIAFGLDIEKVSDREWRGRSVSFEDSILIDQALAEYMHNDAHIPKPIQYEKSLLNKSEPILDAQTWLRTIAEGYWPVAMQKKSLDGTEWFPFEHDVSETHRAVMQYALKSTQQLITDVAQLDLVRVTDGRKPIVLSEDKDWIKLYGLDKNGMTRSPSTSGLNLLDEVSDNSEWVQQFEKLLEAPKGSLSKAMSEVESFLNIDTAPVDKIADSSLLKGQITLFNYKMREIQGRNMTDNEVRATAHNYIQELHTHLQIIRGSD